MVERYVRARGIEDERVLQALLEVPRHLFVEEALQDRAYGEDALPIGFGQTISRPYIVARMTELLEPSQEDTVLEVGTGSGYQAAVLCRLSKRVYTLERIPEIAERARAILGRLGIRNVRCRASDGSAGWPAAAPFARILVTAGSARVPEDLIGQLSPEGGRMVVPVGPPGGQVLMLLHREGADVERCEIEGCEFVPLIRGA